ncbi:hypothetical protein ACHAQA_001271 [Verticillium albo-atrum]
MSQETPHHPSYASGLQGTDSLSYSHSNLGTTPSASSAAPTYEQRAQSSGLGGATAASTLPADHHHTPSTSTGTSADTGTGTGTNTHRNPDGTVPTVPAAGHVGTPHGDDAAPSVSPAGQSRAKGDSRTGKLMEKAGAKLHSAKLAEKGEAKREKAANA